MDKNTLRYVAEQHKSGILQPFDVLMEIDNGFEAICTFVEHMGGTTVYVPSARTIFARCIEMELQENFKGGNIASVARKYGYTERHLRRILGHP